MGISAEKHPARLLQQCFYFQHQLSFICIPFCSLFHNFWPWNIHLSSYEGQRTAAVCDLTLRWVRRGERSAVTHRTFNRKTRMTAFSDTWTTSSELDVHTGMLTTQICCNIWRESGVPGSRRSASNLIWRKFLVGEWTSVKLGETWGAAVPLFISERHSGEFIWAGVPVDRTVIVFHITPSCSVGENERSQYGMCEYADLGAVVLIQWCGFTPHSNTPAELLSLPCRSGWVVY